MSKRASGDAAHAAIDNFLECFHCRNAHPTFSQTLDVSRTAIAVDGIVCR